MTARFFSGTTAFIISPFLYKYKPPSFICQSSFRYIVTAPDLFKS